MVWVVWTTAVLVMTKVVLVMTRMVLVMTTVRRWNDVMKHSLVSAMELCARAKSAPVLVINKVDVLAKDKYVLPGGSTWQRASVDWQCVSTCCCLSALVVHTGCCMWLHGTACQCVPVPSVRASGCQRVCLSACRVCACAFELQYHCVP